MHKRYLLITPIFPSGDADSDVVTFITNFCRNLSELPDVTIDVITMMYPFADTPYKMGKIRVFPIGSGFKRGLGKLPMLLKSTTKGVALARQNQYDGILCFWYREAAFVGRLINYCARTQLRIWMQGQDVRKDNKYLQLIKIPAESLIMLSAQQRELFNQTHKIYVNRIANVCVDRRQFPPINLGKRSITIVGAGNLGALKNYSRFIDVISIVKTSFPQLKAVICGDGEQRAILAKKAADAGVEQNICFLGKVSHQQVLDTMNDAKVFLHTATFEGGGAVLLEALYSGCKVVSTVPISEHKVENFVSATEVSALADLVCAAIRSNEEIKRVEPFKMEETVNSVLESFAQASQK